MQTKDNFDIYVGSRSGVFKGIKVGKEKSVMQNIQHLVSITEDDEVSTISWGDDEETEILIACGNKGTRSIKVYNTDCSAFTCSFFCNVGTGRISGITRYNEAIMTAVQSGEVKLWRIDEEDRILLNAGENLDRMRHSRANKNIIATGGQEHSLKLFDIERQKQIFVEKNVQHDWLQLRVPIWISDINFLDDTQIVTVGRYGHVRLYDPKSQRRPVINIEIKDEALTTLTTTAREKQVIVGSGKGKMNLVDLRNPAKVLNTYKGFTGSITGLGCSRNEPYVVSVSLDRHLRIHHIDTKALLNKIYLTSRISCMLLRSDFSLVTENKNDEESIQKYTGGLEHETEMKNPKTREGTSDSDSEYDRIFDPLQVVGMEEEPTKMKRRITKEDSLSNDKTVSENLSLRRNGRSKKSSKRIKSSLS